MESPGERKRLFSDSGNGYSTAKSNSRRLFSHQIFPAFLQFFQTGDEERPIFHDYEEYKVKYTIL